MNNPRCKVSDRAIVRYLERVQGININAVRRKIGKAVILGDEHPDARGVFHGGYLYRIRNRTVVTVLSVRRNRKKSGKGQSNGK
ncbi:hypothetical protein [Pseudophaeobacter sp.]|uniref:hypothetical protein n=1 Tax=Pseudophaeobacter sp. TaxID=1971739 RepID=UPI00260FAE3C|nr:hypothetical protein [Pseudophaeobacter sp.]